MHYRRTTQNIKNKHTTSFIFLEVGMGTFFTYLFCPHKLLGVIWRYFIRFWWILLILVYIFRSYLFSNYIIQIVQRQGELAGWETKIGSFQGSYIFGFSFHDIQLTQKQNENNINENNVSINNVNENNVSINNVSIKSLKISYNIFAPLVGKKILQSITLENPCIHLILPESNDSNHIPSDSKDCSHIPSNIPNISDIDLRPLWENMPKIKIIESCIHFQQSNQKIQCENLSLECSTQGGIIQFQQLHIETDKKQQLSNFSLSWSLKKSKCKITDAQVQITGIPGIITLPNSLLFDISSPNINLKEFRFDLSENGFIEGSCDLKQGIFLNIGNLLLDLKNIKPWSAFLWQEFSLPCFLRMDIRIQLPEWDFTQLGGNIRCYLGEKNELNTLSSISPQNDLTCEIGIQNISYLQNILKKNNISIPHELLQSKFWIQTFGKITDDKIQGTFQSQLKNFAYPFLQAHSLQTNGQISSTFDGQQINIDSLYIRLMNLLFQCKATMTKQNEQRNGTFQGELSFPNLSFLSPTIHNNSWNTAMKQTWHGTYQYYPTDIQKTNVNINWNMQLSQILCPFFTLPTLHARGKFFLTPKKWKIHWLQIKDILRIKGQGTFQKLQLTGTIHLANILPHIQKHLPQYRDILPIDGTIHFKMQGNFQNLQTLIHINLKGNGTLYNTISSQIHFLNNPITLHIKSLHIDNKKCCTSKTTFQNNDWDSHVQCKIQNIGNYLQKLQIPLQVHADLQTKINSKGNLKQGKSTLSLLLKNIIFEQKNIDNIRLQIYTTWKNKQIKNRLQIHIGSIQIKGNANIHLTKKQYKTNIHIQIPHIQDIPYISQNTIQGTCAIHLQSQGTFTKNNTNISCQFPTLHIGKITYRDLNLQANLNYDDHYIQTQCEITFPQGNITTQGNIHLKTTTYQATCNLQIHDIQNFPGIPKDTIQGTFTTNIQSQGNFAELATCNITSHLQAPQNQHKTLPPLTLQSHLLLQNYAKNIQIKLCNLIANNEQTLLQLQGNLQEQQTDIQFKILIHEILSIFFSYFDQKCKITGEWPLTCKITGTNNWQTKNIHWHIQCNSPWIATHQPFNITHPYFFIQGKKNNGFFADIHLQYDNEINIQSKTNIEIFKITMTDQSMNIRDFQCNINIQNKNIQAQGSTLLGGAPLTWNISTNNNIITTNIQGDNILIIRNKTIYLRTDADIQIQTKKQHDKWNSKIQGKINLTDCRIKAQMTLDSLRQPKIEQETIQIGWEIPNHDVELDIQIHTPKIPIKNQFIQLTTQGNITIQETLAHPLIQGTFQSQGGQLYMPQGVMEIRECIVRIQPENPLAPDISLRAETRIQNYKIFANLEKKDDKFSLEFKSIPPLEQEDVLAILLTGATRSELQNGADKKMKETGSFILMQQLLNYIGIGAYVSAQITEEKATITIMPPEWNGFAIRTITEQNGKVGLQILFRFEFSSQDTPNHYEKKLE